MEKLIIAGTEKINGKEIKVIEGGFGPRQRVIFAKEIAEHHNMSTKRINELISNNLKHLEYGVDIIDIKFQVGSNDLENIVNLLLDMGYNKASINRKDSQIYILSQRGYIKIVSAMRSMKDDGNNKWKIMNDFIDNYFNMSKKLKEVTHKLKIANNKLKNINHQLKDDNNILIGKVESQEKEIFILKREWNNFCDLKTYYNFKWNATEIKSILHRGGYIRWEVGDNDEDLIVEFTEKGLKKFGNGTWRTHNCGYKEVKGGPYIPKRTIQFNKHGIQTIKDIFYELGCGY